MLQSKVGWSAEYKDKVQSVKCKPKSWECTRAAEWGESAEYKAGLSRHPVLRAPPESPNVAERASPAYSHIYSIPSTLILPKNISWGGRLKKKEIFNGICQ